MAVIKCPRCEINYMKEGEACCSVCQRELNRGRSVSQQDEIEMCSECGEYAVEPGEELCEACLSESRRLLEVVAEIERLRKASKRNISVDVEDDDDDQKVEEIPLDLVDDDDDEEEIPDVDFAELEDDFAEELEDDEIEFELDSHYQKESSIF